MTKYLIDKKNPIKMCIESAPYLHTKRAKWALNIRLFLCVSADDAH